MDGIIKKSIIFLLLFTLMIPSCSAFATPRRVTLLMGGNPNDEGFNLACITGLEIIQKRHPQKIKTFVVNAQDAREPISDVINSAAQNSDLLIVTIPDYKEYLESVVKKNPTVKVVTFDKTDIKGVSAVVFREEEGSFLAGALAAMITGRTDVDRLVPSKKIGLILGRDDSAMSGFKNGYIAGAWYIDRNVEVITESIGNFIDTEKCKNIAIAMKKRGVSVIFTAAGAAGLGAINAAKENGYWVIGVDNEQEVKYPDAVLVSVVKRGGYAVYKIVSDFIAGKESGDYISIGIAEDGMNISTWTRESKHNIPADIRNKLDEIADKIVNKLLIIK